MNVHTARSEDAIFAGVNPVLASGSMAEAFMEYEEFQIPYIQAKRGCYNVNTEEIGKASTEWYQREQRSTRYWTQHSWRLVNWPQC